MGMGMGELMLMDVSMRWRHHISFVFCKKCLHRMPSGGEIMKVVRFTSNLLLLKPMPKIEAKP